MSRWVIPQRTGLRSESGEKSDGPIDRVVKYVPSEVVSAFTLLFTSLVTLGLPAKQAHYAGIALILFFLFITVAYVYTRTTGEVRKAHLIVSPLAFLAWAYPISSAVLGEFFVGVIAFTAQAVVIGLAIIIVPREA